MDKAINNIVEDLKKRAEITKTKSELEEERKIKDIEFHSEKYMQSIAYMIHHKYEWITIKDDIPLDHTKYAEALVNYINTNSSYNATIKYNCTDFPYGSSDIKTSMCVLVRNPNILTSTFWEKVAKIIFG